MKKTRVISTLVIICLLMSLFCVPALATEISEEDLSVSNGCHSIDAQVPMITSEEPISNVFAAFLYDYTNDTLIYSHNADEFNYPASLVKIMTGLIVAEKADMSEEITIREDVLSSLPENVLGVNLQAGEIISMQDLFYCAIVESANDATVVIADHIYGSQSAFVDEMNDYAERLGCTNTNFTNVTGLHDPNQYSTARDLARILTAAAQNEVFMDAFSTVNYTVPATNMSESRYLSSSNYMMNDDMMTIYLDSRVTGGRAGVIESGQRNLAATAERNDIKLVSIVLGSADVVAENGWTVVEFGSFKETTQLLNMGFQGHHSVQLFYENQALKQFKVKNGESYVSTGITHEVQVLLPYGVTYDDLEYRYNEATTNVTAPVKKGDEISSVQVWYDGVCLGYAKLYALHDVNVAQAIDTPEVENEKSRSGSSILIVVVVITALLLFLLVGRRFISRMMHKRRVRRYHKNRRRSR